MFTPAILRLILILLYVNMSCCLVCPSFFLSYLMINKINPPSLILTTSSMKQLSMICKINNPFKLCQFVFKKGVKSSFVDLFRTKCDESGSVFVYIHREYDGSERYALLYPQGYSIDFFPQDENLIFLS